MQETLELLISLRQVVTDPTWPGALSLFLVSLVNEIVALFPLAVVIAGQLVFLDGPITADLLWKLTYLVAIPVGIGSALGTLPLYALSYFGSHKVIDRMQQHLSFTWQDVEKVTKRFRGEWYDEIVFLLLRSVPLLPSIPFSIAAGILRMPFTNYLLLSLVGFCIRMILTMAVFGFGIVNLSKFLVFVYNI